MAETVAINSDIKRALFIRQIMFLFAVAASVAIGVYVVLWSQQPNYSLLYGSLSDQDASQVIESLQKANIAYKVDQNSGAVMVASAKVHEARMKLAEEGLPRSANSGFSILNEEQKLGTSQFMEKARYQHALENELALSIAKVSAVKAARVHLAVPKESVFLRNRKAASASVLLDLYPGHRLEAGQVAAIANLVAASVPSLQLSNVSIIDQHGNLMSQNHSSADLALSTSQFQYATQVENSYIERIENILIPLLGPDGVKAQVTAEIDFTRTERTQESFNPDMPALRSEQVEEDRSSSGNIAGGVPGALSNQPAIDGTAPEVIGDSDSGDGKTSSGSGSSQSRATRNYELDKTISHTRLAMGSLVKLSVAVVIDYKKSLNSKGEVNRVEHTPEEIEQITNLVKEAIGFNIIRGDRVNVMNSPFNIPDAVEPLPELPIWQQAWVWDIAKQAVGALFVLFLVFGVLRPSIKNMMNKEITLHQTALAGPTGAVAGQLTNESGEPQPQEIKALEAAPEYDKSISNVKEMVNTDPKLAAQVVRNWVGEE
ncbi:MAG: flagellar M-ring protein FliF [Proteobacteria bacterium]|nr:flagellar basal body M-ring protein FliF [Pseudomonadota bacterium]NOG58937.1 flagellar M-ring protein FliF [Pseudomonadota bacterium]